MTDNLIEVSDEQLDLFQAEEPVERERVYQLTELPGTTWEDIFGGAA